MRVAACQVPDLREEMPRAISMIRKMASEPQTCGADIVLFPECFLQGYFTDAQTAGRLAIDLNSRMFQNILEELRGVPSIIVVGLIEKAGDNCFNTAAVISDGTLVGRYRKTSLLDCEKAVFRPGRDVPIFEIAGLKVGINICYDLNFPEPIQKLAARGVEVVVCPCNNMMSATKAEEYKQLHNETRCKRAVESGVWIVSSDVTGTRGGRVSYGPTAAISPDGAVLHQLPLLATGTLVIDI